MSTQYRVENKENVHFNGKKTGFKIFVMNDGEDSYLYEGNYFAMGWDRTDSQCIDQYLYEIADEDGGLTPDCF